MNKPKPKFEYSKEEREGIEQSAMVNGMLAEAKTNLDKKFTQSELALFMTSLWNSEEMLSLRKRVQQLEDNQKELLK